MRTDIKGTAIMPEDHFLWILVHRIRGFEDLWWPQGEVKVNPKSSTWIKTVRFGEERDIGYQFEIAVITVGKNEHELIKEVYLHGKTNWQLESDQDAPYNLTP